jgi:hypothetical protein
MTERKREWDKEVLRRLVRAKQAEQVSSSMVDQFELHEVRRTLKTMSKERKPCATLDREVSIMAKHVLKGRPEPVRERARLFLFSWWDAYQPKKCDR